MGKLLGIKELCEFWQSIKSALNLKVDKEAGKGLSSNDYTTAEKNKLAGIEAGAQVNRTYTAFTGKPTGNQTPGFGATFTLSQISQGTTGQVSGTDRTVKIPDTAATTSAAGLMSANDKTKLNYTNVCYATCSTAAGTAAKAATIVGNTKFALQAGSIVGVRFTNTNTAASPTLNVGGTGAKNIQWGATAPYATGNWIGGQAGWINYYMYDGTYWVFMGHSADNNTWQQNTASANGYVLSGSGHANQVWKTDADGVPAWRNDSNTWQQNTASANGYVTAGSGHANQVWKTNADGVPAWRNDANTTYSNATQSTAGLMSAADKKRFDNIVENLVINREIYKANVTFAASSYQIVDIGAVPTVSGFYFMAVNNAYITSAQTTGATGTTWTFINSLWYDSNDNHVYANARNFMTSQAKVTIGARLLYLRDIS